MKIFVLGLDGATFRCLTPLMEEGVIPNITAMYKDGASGPLRTIFPPVTAPAWLALATGLNPGKTGVFDYINKTDKDSSRMAPISSAYYKGRAVWDILNERGYKVGIFNYPTLSPPPEVNGFAVTGMGAYKGENLCFPRNLEAELHRITNGYETNLNLRSVKYKRNIALFFEDINRIAEKQFAALKFLVREKEWDFFWAVFSFTDWMQHVLWKYIDPGHTLHDPKASVSVLEKYRETWRKIDTMIGDLLVLLPETHFIIVSDHGAGPIDSVFYPNTWLKNKGWLKEKRLGWRGFLARQLKLFSAGSDNKYTSKVLHMIRSSLLHVGSSVDLIDVDRSMAYSPEHNTMFGCINLTEKGRTASGFKEQLLKELKRLPDEADGINRIEVVLPHDIYSGPYVNHAPDIFFVINDYRSTVEIDLGRKSFIPHPSIEMRTGGHSIDGAVIARGDVFRQAKLQNISVLDIAPTITALYDIDLPPDMDGRVVTEMIKPEALQSVNVRRGSDMPREEKAADAQGDLEEMKKMLTSLGYM